MTEPTKICTRCNQTKSLDEFKSDSRKPGGKASSCKACNTAVGYVAAGALTDLSVYDQARALLAKAKAVDEVKFIMDRTAMLKEYARRTKDRSGLIDYVEIMFHAERRMGEMILSQKETIGFNVGTRGQLRGKNPASGEVEKEAPDDSRPTLADVGISSKLSSHAQKMAVVPEDEFQARVDAWRDEMSAGQTRVTMDLMKIGEDAQKKERREIRERVLGGIQLALPDKKYGVILTDCEWRFEPYSRETGMDRAADNHYLTSKTSEILVRRVQDIAAADCVLFHWATMPMLPDALLVMAAWGFEYKTHCVWVKDRIGPGYWFRMQHEILLVGTRGNIPAPAMGTQFPSVFDARRKGHSEKPPTAHEMIEAYFPNLPKIELNARQARAGWDAWGLEAPLPGLESATSDSNEEEAA